MKDIKVIDFDPKYIDKIIELFKIVIKDSFIREGLENETKELNNLIQSKIKLVKDYLDSKDNIKKMFIVVEQDKVVGVIALTEVSDIIKNNYQYDYNNTVGISSLYILPEYQSKGIGKSLIVHTIQFLENNTKIRQYFVYSGFKIAQIFWNKFLGKPNHILINYYKNSDNCYIWHKKINKK